MLLCSIQSTAPGPERQLTLRHATEWSYDLLTEDERALLRTAAVFSGGFDLTSLVAIVGDAEVCIMPAVSGGV